MENSIMNLVNEASMNVSVDEMLVVLKKQKELDDFYATYDIWIGVRTAITLALFFSFTVTAILYKSQCKRDKTYELDPNLEEGKIADANEYWCPSPVDGYINFDDRMYSKERLHRPYEHGYYDIHGSAPIPVQHGSYLSLNGSFRAKSLPGSTFRINLARMESVDIDKMYGESSKMGQSDLLHLPGKRMHSNGSSSDGYSICSSGYDNTITGSEHMSHLGIPGTRSSKKPMLQLGGMDWDSDVGDENSQAIGIKVINPTPNVSPCGSVKSITNLGDSASLHVPSRRGSSICSYDSRDYDDSCSVGSDSVFDDHSVYDNVSNNSHLGLQAVPTNKLSPKPSKKSKNNSRFLQISTHRPTTPSFPLCLSPLPSIHKSPSECTSNLAIPAILHINKSFERLNSYRSGASSLTASSVSIAKTDSLDNNPVITTYNVPNVRRCNSVLNSSTEICEGSDTRFRRAESDTTRPVKRSDSAENRTRRSSASSSGSDDCTESLSFHLMVPTLSVDYPSFDTSRGSSPTNSASPPGSPIYGTSLSVPIQHSRSTSPSRGRMRLAGVDGRGILIRQYSQFRPLSPRDKSPSPFGLPTSFEEEETEPTEETKNRI